MDSFIIIPPRQKDIEVDKLLARLLTTILRVHKNSKVGGQVGVLSDIKEVVTMADL